MKCYRNDNIIFSVFCVFLGYVDVKMLARSISMFILSVLCIRKFGPCNGNDGTAEVAYLVDRPTVGYRGVN